MVRIRVMIRFKVRVSVMIRYRASVRDLLLR